MNVIPKSRRVVPFPSPPGAHSSTEGKRNGDQPLFIDGLDLAGAAHLAAHLARALQKSKLWAQYTARAHVEQLVFSPAALCSGERSGEHSARSALGRPSSLVLRVSFIKALVPVVKVESGLRWKLGHGSRNGAALRDIAEATPLSRISLIGQCGSALTTLCSYVVLILASFWMICCAGRRHMWETQARRRCVSQTLRLR